MRLAVSGLIFLCCHDAGIVSVFSFEQGTAPNAFTRNNMIVGLVPNWLSGIVVAVTSVQLAPLSVLYSILTVRPVIVSVAAL